MAAIYEPKGAAREYSPLALNFIIGCDHGCKYCYVPIIKKEHDPGYVHSNVFIKDEKKLLEEIEASCKKYANSDKQVLLSFLTDPYCSFNEKTKLTRKVLELLLQYNIPVSILSKGGLRILEDLDIIKQFGANIQVGASLTFTNKEDSLKWEPGAALPEERLEVLKRLHDEGIRTWASMEPVIFPDQSLEIMQLTHSYVDGYKIGKLNHFPKYEGKFDWSKFLTDSVSIMRKYGKKFYIKKDLLDHKEKSLYLSPEETDMDYLAINNSRTKPSPQATIETHLQDSTDVIETDNADNVRTSLDQVVEENTSDNQEIEDIDSIPQSVYDNLPILLKDSCSIFNDRHERDIFLLGALSALGGCFHNLYAYNDVDKKKVAANLLTFIVAPPASGKGVLKYVKKMITEINNSFTANTKVLGAKAQGKLPIPANISSAGIMQLLQKNKGVGIIIESEIDTLVNANKQDWGNYSDILRNAFENESASLYRKTEKESIEIENLKLSMAVSGTPNQFRNLMFSVENGLFSRGCYYVFDSSNPKLTCYGRMNTNGKDLDDLFAEIANIANDYYNLHLQHDKIEIIFNEQQLNEIQTSLQEEFNRISSIPELRANINRSFSIALKIATLFAFLKECETGNCADKINCSATALQTAVQLMQTNLRHSYKAFELLPKRNKSFLTIDQQRFYYELPTEFKRLEAIPVAEKLGIGIRNMGNYLKVFKEKQLVDVSGKGNYKKKE
jgi:DNA repair photolyase